MQQVLISERMGRERWMISDITKFIDRQISLPIKQRFSPFNEAGVKFQLLRREEGI